MRLCRQKDTPHICRCIYPYMNMFTHVYRGCIGITTLMWWVQGLGFCMCAWGCGQLSQTSLHSIPIYYEKEQDDKQSSSKQKHLGHSHNDPRYSSKVALTINSLSPYNLALFRRVPSNTPEYRGLSRDRGDGSGPRVVWETGANYARYPKSASL